MKTYRIWRTPGGAVKADVANGDSPAYSLPHLVHHSPTGFEFGYGGSGPADLARSIVGDLRGTRTPDGREYMAVKWNIVAKIARDLPGTFEVTEDEVLAAIEEGFRWTNIRPTHKKRCRTRLPTRSPKVSRSCLVTAPWCCRR